MVTVTRSVLQNRSSLAYPSLKHVLSTKLSQSGPGEDQTLFFRMKVDILDDSLAMPKF